MSRKALRWTIFFALSASVIGLAIFNAAENRALVTALSSESSISRSQAFAELAERSDAYSLVLSQSVSYRRTLAKHLSEWPDARAIDLALTLLSDDDTATRVALTQSLSEIAARYPAEFLASLASTAPVQRAQLLDAASNAANGVDIARRAHGSDETRQVSFDLFVRLGQQSIPTLVDIAKERRYAIDALNALRSLGNRSDARVRKIAWNTYANLPLDARASFFGTLAYFAPVEARRAFADVLRDEASPAWMRRSSAQALATMDADASLAEFVNDADEHVANIAKTSRTEIHQRLRVQAFGGDIPSARVVARLAAHSEADRFALVALLRSQRSTPVQRQFAADALANLGPRGARMLEQALADDAAGPAAALATQKAPSILWRSVASLARSGNRWAEVALKMHKNLDNPIR
jgi:hypothetical protein